MIGSQLSLPSNILLRPDPEHRKSLSPSRHAVKLSQMVDGMFGITQMVDGMFGITQMVDGMFGITDGRWYV